MKEIKNRILALQKEKKEILNKYPEEDEPMQGMYAMVNIQLELEIKFLTELDKQLTVKAKNKEYILCPSCWYDDGIKHVHQPTNIKVGYITSGQRHHNCMGTFAQIVGFPYNEKALKINRTEVQGFLTSKNRFVGRKLALKIAIESLQLMGKDTQKATELHSEDLY